MRETGPKLSDCRRRRSLCGKGLGGESVERIAGGPSRHKRLGPPSPTPDACLRMVHQSAVWLSVDQHKQPEHIPMNPPPTKQKQSPSLSTPPDRSRAGLTAAPAAAVSPAMIPPSSSTRKRSTANAARKPSAKLPPLWLPTEPTPA